MSITKSQLREVAETMFKDIDTNGNGALEKEEVKAFSIRMMEKLKPDAEFNEEKFEQNFADLDKNSDGKVDFNELWKSLIEKAEKGGVLADE